MVHEHTEGLKLLGTHQLVIWTKICYEEKL